MQVTSPNNVAGGNSAGRSTNSPRNTVKPEEFYQLLVTQLQAQDPLKPADNQAILQQFAMIRQLESSEELKTTLGQMVTQDRVGSYSALIGKYVRGNSSTTGGGTEPVQGLVVAVSITGEGEAILELHNGKRLPANRVAGVTDPSYLEGAAGGDEPTDTTADTGDDASAGDATARARLDDPVSRVRAQLLQNLISRPKTEVA